MAFQSSTPPGRRTVLDIQNETETTLSYRSRQELSNLCRSLGIPYEGTYPELITRILNWKSAYGVQPSAAAFSPGSMDLPPDVSSWLNISERLLDEEESFGISKLNINDQSVLNHRNHPPSTLEAPHPIQAHPVAQPNLVPVKTFLPPLPEKPRFEVDASPGHLTHAPIDNSTNIFGSLPEHHQSFLAKKPTGTNHHGTDQNHFSGEKMDNKAEHISLTIEGDEASHASGQNSRSVPFPFPQQNHSGGGNPVPPGKRGNVTQEANDLAYLSQVNTELSLSGSEGVRDHPSNDPRSSNNPFLYPSGVPGHHTHPDPALAQLDQEILSPAQVQATNVESVQNRTTFSPANQKNTQTSMPWIQMNWGSPPTHDRGQSRPFQQHVSPPAQHHFPGQFTGNPSPAMDPRHPHPADPFHPTPAQDGMHGNPFEPHRRTSLVPEQRQIFSPVLNPHQTPPSPGMIRHDFPGQLPHVQPQVQAQSQAIPVPGFGHHYSPSFHPNATPPTQGFMQNQPTGHYLQMASPNQFHAQPPPNPLIDMASPPDHYQASGLDRTKPPGQLRHQNESHNPFPHLNYAEDHLPHRNFIPHDIATQESVHTTSGSNLLFQSLWGNGEAPGAQPTQDYPFRDSASVETPQGVHSCRSQITSPESAGASGFNSGTSQGYENPISITTDWAATPKTSHTRAQGLTQVHTQAPAQVPEPAPAKAPPPAPSKLLPTSQIEELLIQETGEGISLIPFTELQIGRQIGTGGYKDCFAGTYKGEVVAVGELKVTQFTREDFLEIKNEVNVLKQVYHENIVRFIGIAKGPEKLCIITEFCQRGDLFDQFRREPKPTFDQQVQIMYDIALGVAYLHARRPSIIHRDLKSMNILINKDSKAKINDFGLARIRSRVRSIAHTQCGTPNWQAPEIFAAKPSYTEKVDVYAVGLIFWEILQWGAQPFPFSDIPESSLEIAIRDKRLRPSFQHVQACPAPLHQLIVQMWDHEPRARPSMAIVIDQLSQLLD